MGGCASRHAAEPAAEPHGPGRPLRPSGKSHHDRALSQHPGLALSLKKGKNSELNDSGTWSSMTSSEREPDLGTRHGKGKATARWAAAGRAASGQAESHHAKAAAPRRLSHELGTSSKDYMRISSVGELVGLARRYSPSDALIAEAACMQLKALWRVDVTSEEESREAITLLVDLSEDHSGDDRVLEQARADPPRGNPSPTILRHAAHAIDSPHSHCAHGFFSLSGMRSDTRPVPRRPLCGWRWAEP